MPPKVEQINERVVKAAHAVAARVGVSKITFRAIASSSGIGLGTLTYHYKDRAQILYAATDHARERFFRRFRTALSDASNSGDISRALATVMELITNEFHAELIVDYDFYLSGLDDPIIRPICDDWVRDTTLMLRDYTSEIEATTLSYLLEGMFLQSAKFSERFDFEKAHRLFSCVLAR